ncbi:uncharacterized protein LOC142181083 [Nicotiana tabacum]|uniref:Uncharacterized protein LOC142181083 n=1 Tax=Nicotiana tabacum TaxID=4097 RepID=A0AC58UIL4_TOBAC
MGEMNETNSSRKYLNLEELNKTKQKHFLLKKPVSAEEAEKFFQKMKISDYAMIDQLRKSPSQVMLDGGSGVDIFPLSTLQRMEIGTERIRPNNVCVRAFDSVKRDTIEKIDLILTIDPMDFKVTFQVLDMDTSYNFLLGRPWIHTAGAVPYTLYQIVKFEHEDQEIVVHGEDEKSIYKDPPVPSLEAKKGSEHIVYQAFEIVVADQCEEGTPCPQPFFSNTSIMVTSEMIKHGYKLGKGLGASLQGITETITVIASEKFFGVSFQATEADVKWANERKNNGWIFPQPVLHLARMFVKPRYIEEEEETFTAEEIADICGAVRQMLYEAHMVQPGEGSSTTESSIWETFRVYNQSEGIELDPTKIKSIQDLPPPRTKKEVMNLLGRYIPRFHNELADALATLALMLPYLGNVHIDPLEIQIRERHGYYITVEIQPDIQLRYHDIKRFLKTKEYPEQASGDQKRTIRRLAGSFFWSGEVLYKKTLDLNLLRCMDAQEAGKIMNEVHDDLIHTLPSELHSMSAPWSFVTWGMDVNGPIELKASNGHIFILVAIDYFTKWVEAVTLKVVTKKAVVDFMHSNIICRFGIPKTIITDNAVNLSSHLMRELSSCIACLNVIRSKTANYM